MKPKEVVLKQLKDLINEICTQKIKYDKKCMETKMARETMEQYMYTYLNQIYGLKPLINDNAKLITEGIEKYCETDLDVFLFQKIMHSEIEEEYMQDYIKLKTNFKSSLKQGFKKKYKNKSEPEAISYIESIYNGSSEIEEWAWKEVVSKMVPPAEVRSINEKIKSILDGKEIKGTTVTLAELQGVIFGEEIQKKAEKNKLLSQGFKEVDEDKNGLINHEQLRALATKAGLNSNIESILKTIDPNDTQQISFSMCFKAASLLKGQSEPKPN